MKNSLFLGLALAALLAAPAWAPIPAPSPSPAMAKCAAAPDMAEVRAGVTTNAPTAARRWPPTAAA